jgi:hypothetical protein
LRELVEEGAVCVGAVERDERLDRGYGEIGIRLRHQSAQRFSGAHEPSASDRTDGEHSTLRERVLQRPDQPVVERRPLGWGEFAVAALGPLARRFWA